MNEREFQISVDIAAPPESVWSVMYEVERWHEWTPSVRGIRVLGKKPLTIGSRVLVRQPKFPPAVWTVTALAPGRRFDWKSGAPGMWVHASHAIEPTAAGSLVRLRLRYEGALGGLFARWTRDITNRYLSYEAEGLKQRSESLVR